MVCISNGFGVGLMMGYCDLNAGLGMGYGVGYGMGLRWLRWRIVNEGMMVGLIGMMVGLIGMMVVMILVLWMLQWSYGVEPTML